MYTMPCVLKTPPASKGMFPEFGPTEIPLELLVNIDTEFLIEIGYTSPLNEDDQVPYEISLYAGDDRIYEKVSSTHGLEPYASGGFSEGVYSYTLNREGLAREGHTDIRLAHAQVKRILSSWLVLPPHVAMCERESMPYLLLSFSTSVEEGRPTYIFRVTVEENDTCVSVSGVKLSRWPIWAYQDAVAEAERMLNEFKGNLATSEAVSGNVVLRDYVQYVNSEIGPEHADLLRQQYQRLKPLAASPIAHSRS
ncbi:hypothetical protein QAO71_17025 (plasmid) [Halopseudomonas sp. SMJS2]|uniref:hypothetical protein n=1 Tax=Halopseudomonas sp. SMJS2 TaxID=3041098 RepID=UPI002452E9D6|nr:hypothetical protein [Halopseudomonas sp. SMJS2]WGK63473.1 hypothetical protein QAO71_17025 [Halopseudomonas sp. SMJS2]